MLSAMGETIGHPHVQRPLTGRVRVLLPIEPRHERLRALTGESPHFVGLRPATGSAEYAVPRTRFRGTVARLAARYGRVTVWLHVSTSARCDIRCVQAERDECVCSCAYSNHAGGAMLAGWRRVGDTTLIGATTAQVQYDVYR